MSIFLSGGAGHAALALINVGRDTVIVDNCSNCADNVPARIAEIAGSYPIAALEYARNHSGVEDFNLGTGHGVSVRELVETFRRVNQTKVPFRSAPRRPGDSPVCFADVEKAEKRLKWRAKRMSENMCRDAWNWNPRRRATANHEVSAL